MEELIKSGLLLFGINKSCVGFALLHQECLKAIARATFHNTLACIVCFSDTLLLLPVESTTSLVLERIVNVAHSTSLPCVCLHFYDIASHHFNRMEFMSVICNAKIKFKENVRMGNAGEMAADCPKPNARA